jgi:hypothetical protein
MTNWGKIHIQDFGYFQKILSQEGKSPTSQEKSGLSSLETQGSLECSLMAEGHSVRKQNTRVICYLKWLNQD